MLMARSIMSKIDCTTCTEFELWKDSVSAMKARSLTRSKECANFGMAFSCEVDQKEQQQCECSCCVCVYVMRAYVIDRTPCFVLWGEES